MNPLRGAGRGIVGRIRGMGGAVVGVLRAELAALIGDLSASGRNLARSLVLFGLAFAFAFWTLGLLVYFLVELLALKVARWGAVGIVFGLFLATALALGAWSLSRLKRIESPAATIDRRLKNHLAWWQERIAGDSDRVAPRAGLVDDPDEIEDEELP